eukprot:7377305-Prymnesium_polylepis.2
MAAMRPHMDGHRGVSSSACIRCCTVPLPPRCPCERAKVGGSWLARALACRVVEKPVARMA